MQGSTMIPNLSLGTEHKFLPKLREIGWNIGNSLYFTTREHTQVKMV